MFGELNTARKTSYHVGIVREMVVAALTADEIKNICMDSFREVYDENLPTNDLARRMVDFAKRRGRLDLLVKAVQERNPFGYEQFKSRLVVEEKLASPKESLVPNQASPFANPNFQQPSGQSSSIRWTVDLNQGNQGLPVSFLNIPPQADEPPRMTKQAIDQTLESLDLLKWHLKLYQKTDQVRQQLRKFSYHNNIYLKDWEDASQETWDGKSIPIFNSHQPECESLIGNLEMCINDLENPKLVLKEDDKTRFKNAFPEFRQATEDAKTANDEFSDHCAEISYEGWSDEYAGNISDDMKALIKPVMKMNAKVRVILDVLYEGIQIIVEDLSSHLKDMR